MARCRRRSAPASPSPSSPLRAPAACSSAPGTSPPRHPPAPPRLVSTPPPPPPAAPPPRTARAPSCSRPAAVHRGRHNDRRPRLPQTNERRLENSPSALVDGRCRRRATASGIEVGVGRQGDEGGLRLRRRIDPPVGLLVHLEPDQRLDAWERALEGG